MTPQDLANLALAVRAELERIGELNSCILAGAVFSEVLRRKGCPGARVLMVNVLVFNPEFARRIKQHGGLPRDDATRSKWEAEGARMIGIGIGTNSPGVGEWPGHLVVIVPRFMGDRHAMCDLTITQANKPEWGIELPPITLITSDPFLSGTAEARAHANGSALVYKSFPEDERYKETPIWRNDRLRDAIVERVILCWWHDYG